MPWIKRSLTAAAALTGVVALGGCETLGNPFDVIAGKRNSPDEFQVLARKPLRMPGSLDLPEPRLGERSPLEPDPNTDAVIALLGAPVTLATAPSSGEQGLLNAANAASSQTEIRQQLDQDLETADDNEPYEAPSIFELFSTSEEAPKDAINPNAEARRLQAEGVSAAPIDPSDRPQEDDGLIKQGEVDLFYRTDDGKPQNKLPSAPTETAF
jgi:hypothetical protein